MNEDIGQRDLGAATARFWSRVWAFGIDLLILGLVEFAVLITAREFAGDLDGLWVVIGLGVIAFLVGTVYVVWPYSTSGQTPGMKVLGIRVVSIDKSDLGLGRAFLRWIGLLSFNPFVLLYLLSFGFVHLIPFGLGYLWAAWDRLGQGWHDKMARTTVVANTGEQTPMLPGMEARRRQRRCLIALAVPLLLLWLPVVPGFLMVSIDTAARMNALRWVNRAASVEKAVNIDLSSFGLELLEISSLRSEGIPGSYSTGAIAKYDYHGQTTTWLVALKYDNSERMEKDLAINWPYGASGMERLLLDKYCQLPSCEWVISIGDDAFVLAIVADGPIISIDVLNSVRELPRGPALRWLHSWVTEVL